jgi:hypothetical protein
VIAHRPILLRLGLSLDHGITYKLSQIIGYRQRFAYAPRSCWKQRELRVCRGPAKGCG